MNKLSILFAAFVSAVAFCACDETKDDNPVLKTHEGTPVVDFLNEPVMQAQYIELTTENETGSLELQCSQPVEYGYAASVRYTPEVSITKDFSDSRVLSACWSTDCASIKMTNRELAEALCEMLDVKQVSDLPQDYMPLYVRLRSQVYSNMNVPIENTVYLSNVVQFDHVKVAYLAVWVKDVPQDLYLVGTMTEWAMLPEFQFYTGDTKNSWTTKSVSWPANTNFKVSPSAWNSQFNGEAFNGGNSGATLAVDTPYELLLDKDSGDIPCSFAFTGVVQLVFNNGKYTITLIPD